VSSASEQHVADLLSTSQDTVGKKKSRVKVPCMLCGGSHQTHLFPRMDETSKLLEDMTISKPQLPVAYLNININPPVLDGMINPVPSSISLVDHIVNLVTSLVELVEKMVDLIPYAVDPTISLESETQVVNPFPPIDPSLPLENESQAVKMISSSIDPTLPLEIKHDVDQVFLVDTYTIMFGGISPSPVEPPPSNEAILFDWGALTRPHLPYHIPFNITVRVCCWDNIHQTLTDEGASVSILSLISWQALGCPQLVPVTQNLLPFKKRMSQPLGTLPQFPVTLGGKTMMSC
jgi:hypothetical protein